MQLGEFEVQGLVKTSTNKLCKGHTCLTELSSGIELRKHELNMRREPRHKKPYLLHISENKNAGQLCGHRAADNQRICFRYKDSTITLLPIFRALSHILLLYSPVCVRLSDIASTTFLLTKNSTMYLSSPPRLCFFRVI